MVESDAVLWSLPPSNDDCNYDEAIINYIIIHNITHFQVLKWKAKIIIITGN